MNENQDTTDSASPGYKPAGPELAELVRTSTTHSEVYAKVFSKMSGKPESYFLPNNADAYALAQLDLAFDYLERVDTALMESTDTTIFELLSFEQTRLALAAFDNAARTLEDSEKWQQHNNKTSQVAEIDEAEAKAEEAQTDQVRVFDVLSGTLYQTEAKTEEEALAKFGVWFNGENCEKCGGDCSCVFEVEALTVTLEN